LEGNRAEGAVSFSLKGWLREWSCSPAFDSVIRSLRGAMMSGDDLSSRPNMPSYRILYKTGYSKLYLQRIS
jgi:hypothetical protein